MTVNDGFCTLAQGRDPPCAGLLMPTFGQIVSEAPALLIDAASSLIQVAVLGPGRAQRWQTSTEESGVAIFRCVEALGADPLAMANFIYCEGPGSVLGIRTAAMALRTWCVLGPRPVFAYSSLAVVAHALRRPDVGVIADARRDSWHHYQMGHGLHRKAAAELGGELVMPANFRHWSTLPCPVATVPYQLESLLPLVWDEELLHATDAPDAFLHEEPSYVAWTPQIHRAPPRN